MAQLVQGYALPVPWVPDELIDELVPDDGGGLEFGRVWSRPLHETWQSQLDDALDQLGDAGAVPLAAFEVALPRSPRAAPEVTWLVSGPALLELADHDGDVDRAVELLSRGEHAQYAAIVERLRRHDRHDAALVWIDRGVAAGRVSGRLGPPNDYWLDPLDVADTYLRLGRVDEAIEVMRREFLAQPGHRTLTQLLAIARRAGSEAGERSWAIATAEEQAARPMGARGAPLVEIALAEGDLDAAWSAAERFGAGVMWKELADASRDTRPRAAGDLYRAADLERHLDRPDTRAYPGIARQLVTVRDCTNGPATRRSSPSTCGGSRRRTPAGRR